MKVNIIFNCRHSWTQVLWATAVHILLSLCAWYATNETKIFKWVSDNNVFNQCYSHSLSRSLILALIASSPTFHWNSLDVFLFIAISNSNSIINCTELSIFQQAHDKWHLNHSLCLDWYSSFSQLNNVYNRNCSQQTCRFYFRSLPSPHLLHLHFLYM